MKKIDLTNLFKLIEEKYEIDTNELHGKNVGFYLSELEGEIKEVKGELKENNSIYLEDELGDIFRCYLNFLKKLEKNGYIKSVEDVFLHADKKFTDRINGRRNGIDWETTKKLQKEELKNRHNLSLLKGYLK